MAKIDSLASFETGHAKIDRDHLRLIELINRMEVGLQAGDLRSCRRFIRSLIRRMRKHYKREGAIIRKIGFPGAAAHCDNHDDTISRAKKFQISFTESSDIELLKEIFDELKMMIIDEIVKDDLDYKPYLTKAMTC